MPHLVLSQSPRDNNQVEKLAQQLARQTFVSLCYKEATSQPFGYLRTDLSPKTSDVVRYRAYHSYFPSEKERFFLGVDDDCSTSVYHLAFKDFFSSLRLTSVSTDL